MGQYWQLINIDKRQSFGHWGKLGEWLYGSKPRKIVPYLAVPAAPPPEGLKSGSLIVSWAGDRILCVGDYADVYPPGILTQEELDECGDSNIYDLAYTSYTKVYPIPSADLSDPTAFAHDQVWVLRNLSKREYIRNDAFEENPEKVSGPLVRGRAGFGEAVLSRISLGEYDYHAKHFHGKITKGAWVGDRFDIQTLDTVDGDDNWKDVSNEVMKTIRRNWYK